MFNNQEYKLLSIKLHVMYGTPWNLDNPLEGNTFEIYESNGTFFIYSKEDNAHVIGHLGHDIFLHKSPKYLNRDVRFYNYEEIEDLPGKEIDEIALGMAKEILYPEERPYTDGERSPDGFPVWKYFPEEFITEIVCEYVAGVLAQDFHKKVDYEPPLSGDDMEKYLEYYDINKEIKIEKENNLGCLGTVSFVGGKRGKKVKIIINSEHTDHMITKAHEFGHIIYEFLIKERKINLTPEYTIPLFPEFADPWST